MEQHYSRGEPGDPVGEVTNEDYVGALVEFAKSCVKLSAVSGVLAFVATTEMDLIGAASHPPPRHVGGLRGHLFDRLIL